MSRTTWSGGCTISVMKNKNKNKFFLLALSLLFFASTLSFAHAATTGYAWSESSGYFDFSGVTVTDSVFSGNAYNDNTGFLVMSGVSNDGAGILSGYAWSESLGYFDFSDVTISNGSFDGYAYNDNSGFLNMDAVTTTWAPAVPGGDDTPRRRGSSRRNVVTTATENSAPVVTPSATTLTNTNRNLSLGLVGSDVRQLQILLNSLGYAVSTSPNPGSAGNETTYFGSLTQAVLARFQAANGIAPAAGYFGPKTKAFMKMKGYIN